MRDIEADRQVVRAEGRDRLAQDLGEHAVVAEPQDGLGFAEVLPMHLRDRALYGGTRRDTGAGSRRFRLARRRGRSPIGAQSEVRHERGGGSGRDEAAPGERKRPRLKGLRPNGGNLPSGLLPQEKKTKAFRQPVA